MAAGKKFNRYHKEKNLLSLLREIVNKKLKFTLSATFLGTLKIPRFKASLHSRS